MMDSRVGPQGAESVCSLMLASGMIALFVLNGLFYDPAHCPETRNYIRVFLFLHAFSIICIVVFFFASRLYKNHYYQWKVWRGFVFTVSGVGCLQLLVNVFAGYVFAQPEARICFHEDRETARLIVADLGLSTALYLMLLGYAICLSTDVFDPRNQWKSGMGASKVAKQGRSTRVDKQGRRYEAVGSKA